MNINIRSLYSVTMPKLTTMHADEKTAKLSFKDELAACLVQWPISLVEIIEKYSFSINFIIGASECNEMANKLQNYMSNGDDWIALPQMNTSRKGSTALRLGNYIYVSGGRSCKHKPLSSMERLNLLSMEWEAVEPMGAAMTNQWMFPCDGEFYVIGCGGNKIMNANQFDAKTRIMIYNETKREWRRGCHFHVPHIILCAAAIEEKVYVFGWRIGSRKVMCGVLDLRVGEWKSIADPINLNPIDTDLFAFGHCIALVVKNRIWLIQQECECIWEYDPKYNTYEPKWQFPEPTKTAAQEIWATVGSLKIYSTQKGFGCWYDVLTETLRMYRYGTFWHRSFADISWTEERSRLPFVSNFVCC